MMENDGLHSAITLLERAPSGRAQCRVILVCSPRLLDVDCKTVEQMRLVNAVCRFVELAEAAPA